MKQRTVWILIISNLILLVVLWPYWEIFLGLVAVFLLFVYQHYWTDKAKYGPYLYYNTNVGEQIVVNWVGVDKKFQKPCEECRVEISESMDFNEKYAFECSSLKILEQRYYYHIQLKDLVKNKKYFYKIYLGDKLIFGGSKFYFTMGPSETENKSNTKVIIYGDDQTADWIPVMAQMHNHFTYKENPNFIIHLGDINQRIFRKGENNAFFTTKQKLFRTIPFMPCIGNHDYPIVEYPKPDDAWKFYDAFYDIPHYYAFNYGSKLKFVCFNTEDPLAPKEQDGNGQYEFIKKALEDSMEENRFVILCAHAGPYNIEQHVQPHEGRIEQVKTHLVPLINQFNKGLQRNILYFNGHIHSYERIIKDKMTYFTIGTCSNAKFYSKLEDREDVKFDSEIAEVEFGKRAFAMIEVDGDKLHVHIKKMYNKEVETLHFIL